jgi:hypothetical protein
MKKVVIEAVLVPEASNKCSEEIEKEIIWEIQRGSIIIPWCDRIEKVKVVDKG